MKPHICKRRNKPIQDRDFNALLSVTDKANRQNINNYTEDLNKMIFFTGIIYSHAHTQKGLYSTTIENVFASVQETFINIDPVLKANFI